MPRKKRGVLRILLWVVGVFAILLIAGFFYLTSAAFLKGTVLPRVGNEINADITVSDATIHPFSSVSLRDLKVTPRGRETLLTAAEVNARYDLWSILRGNIVVENVTLTGPVIHLVQRADGTSNLDPLLENVDVADNDNDDEKESGDSEPPRVDLRKLSISNALLRHETQHGENQRSIVEITNANILLTNLKNGDSGKVTIGAALSANLQPPSPDARGALHAALNGEYVFALSADFKPLSVKGEAAFNVTSAEGTFSDFSGFSAVMAADVAPTEITEVALQFTKAQDRLGQVRVSGPFNAETSEGRLNVEVLAIDRRVLNLIGASMGLDFGTTAINSTNQVELTQRGSMISIAGRLAVDRMQLIRTNLSTPTLNIESRYAATLNLASGNVVLRAFELTGTQNSQPLFQGGLSSPMTLSLGGSNEAFGDSTLNLALTGLNLQEWKAFLGDIPSGNISARVTVNSRNSGNFFQIAAQSQIANVGPINGGMTLRSAVLLGEVGVQMAEAQKAFQGSMSLSNVVVLDPSGAIPAKPLDARFDFDTTIAGDVIELRRFQVALTPTERARNELQLQGRVDLTDTNAIRGDLKLTAEALDLTTYYDLFAGGTNGPGSTTTGTTETPPVETDTPSDSLPSSLPFKDFTAEATIGQFFLREIVASNFTARVQLDGGKVEVGPFDVYLNGAPMKAGVGLDLSVPGYQYALTFSASQVPFAPLVNTFQPDRKGELGGTLTADVNLRGTGTTGASLQKTLAGRFDVGTTNLNLSAANVRQPMLKLLVGVIAMVPQLAQNPEAALGSLVSGLGSTLTRGLAGSFSGDITNSPIDVIAARGSAADGKIELEQATVRSTVFRADARGTVTLAPVLTNSEIHFPVSIALARPLAERLKMVSSDTPTNAAYVKLPDFFSEGGTIGNPKAQIDKKVLAGSLLQQLGSLVPGATATNSAVGNVLQGLGSILGGRPAASPTNAPPGTISAPAAGSTAAQSLTTNAAPATNVSPLNEVLRLLGPRTKPQ